LVYQYKKSQLWLKFNRDHDSQREINKSSLGGFCLQKSDYQLPLYRKQLVSKQLTQSMHRIHGDLVTGTSVTKTQLNQALGRPLAKLMSPNGDEILLYSPYLMITMDGEELKRIHYTENVVSEQAFKKFDKNLQSWKLADTYFGQTSVDAKTVLGKVGFETEDKIEYEVDDHVITLFFSVLNGDKTVTELKLEYF
jgi:hypothetical protein